MKKEILSLLSMIFMIYFGVAFANTYETKYLIPAMVFFISTVGIIIALLASKDSPYLSFHVRQALKFTVLEVLTGIITLLLIWTFIVPIAAGIFGIVLFVCKIIAFFSICKGNAKEPYVVRSFNFLK